MIDDVKSLMVEAEYWVPEGEELLAILEKEGIVDPEDNIDPDELRENLVMWLYEVHNYIPG